MGRARRRPRRGAARHDRARLLPPPPALRAPLPAAPALRAGGADPRREVALRAQRLDAPVRGADRVDRRSTLPEGGEPGRARGRARAALLPRPRGAPRRAPRPSPPRSRPACASAATCSTRCSPTRWSTTGCARYPHWLASRNLANEASDESVERADRGRPRPLRAAAPLVPAEGAAARPRPAGRLRPHGGRHRRGARGPVGRREGHGARVVRRLRARDGATRRGPSSTSAGSTRPCAPASAAARSAPTPCRAPRRT